MSETAPAPAPAPIAWKGPDFDLDALEKELMEAIQELHRRRPLEELAKLRPHQGTDLALKALGYDEDAMAGIVEPSLHGAAGDLLVALSKMKDATYDLEIADEAVQRARVALGLRPK